MSEDICKIVAQEGVAVVEDVPNKIENGDINLVDSQKAEQSTTPISKKQLKRLAKQEKWIAGKADRRKREKEKRKKKRAQHLQSGKPLDPNFLSRKRRRDLLVKQADSPCKVTVVVDCDYADFMNPTELKKLCKQMNW